MGKKIIFFFLIWCPKDLAELKIKKPSILFPKIRQSYYLYYIFSCLFASFLDIAIENEEIQRNSK